MREYLQKSLAWVQFSGLMIAQHNARRSLLEILVELPDLARQALLRPTST